MRQRGNASSSPPRTIFAASGSAISAVLRLPTLPVMIGRSQICAGQFSCGRRITLVYEVQRTAAASGISSAVGLSLTFIETPLSLLHKHYATQSPRTCHLLLPPPH